MKRIRILVAMVPLAMIAATPAAADHLVSCKMRQYCVNEFECEHMDTFIKFSTGGPMGGNQGGSGELLIEGYGDDSFDASYEMDAYGVLSATVTQADNSITRLLVGGDGLGVAQLFFPDTKMSTLLFGTCTWL